MGLVLVTASKSVQSKSVQMLGWFRDEIVFASRSNRARNCSFDANPGGEDLDRDGALEAGVASLPDLPHPPRAQRRSDLVRAEPCSGLDCHGSGEYGAS
jgi:hypothetical protein